MRARNAERYLSVINLTQTAIEISLEDLEAAQCRTLQAHETAAISYLQRRSQLGLSMSRLGNSEKLSDSKCKIRLKKRITGRQKWEEISCANGIWRIYRQKISQRHHRILVFTYRPLSSWMKEIPDSVLLSNLCLPGTHETMALYGWPFSQCQDVTLQEQFHQGVRMLDIRIVLVDGVLKTFHGATPQRRTFTSILEDVCSYLRSVQGQSETVIMSIMEESSFIPSSPLFSGRVRDAIFNAPSDRSMWYLENRIPTLGEVRGKIVMFSRFGRDGSDWEGGLNGIGIHPSRWPNSRREGFEWELEKTRIRTQDWYLIPSFFSIPEKFAVAVQMLEPKPAPEGKDDLAITFFSASRIPFALPSTVACGTGWRYLGMEGVNSRAGQWLLEKLGGDPTRDSTKFATGLDSAIDASQLTLIASRQEMSEKFSDLPLKPTVSQINPLEADARLRGWVMIDFIMNPEEHGIIPLLIECNWRGRIPGEEGWNVSTQEPV